MAMTRPESEAAIEGMFDRVAPRYDFLNALLSMRQDRRWRRHLLAQVPERRGGAFLDVATGTGDVLIAARRKRQEYGSFLGVDISQDMLKLAQRKSAGFSSPLPKYKKMSACDLQLENASIDCLTISFGLRNVVDKERALSEFHRVLKPGGVLLILEFYTPENSVLAKLFLSYFHHVLPAIAGLISDREAYHYLPRSVSSYYDRKGLEKALTQQGFSDLTWTSFLFGACRLIRATR